jgi:hypothetical protein
MTEGFLQKRRQALEDYLRTIVNNQAFHSEPLFKFLEFDLEGEKSLSFLLLPDENPSAIPDLWEVTLPPTPPNSSLPWNGTVRRLRDKRVVCGIDFNNVTVRTKILKPIENKEGGKRKGDNEMQNSIIFWIYILIFCLA